MVFSYFRVQKSEVCANAADLNDSKGLGSSLSTAHAGMPMCAALNDLREQV